MQIETVIESTIISEKLTTYTIPFNDLSKLSLVWALRQSLVGHHKLAAIVSEDNKCTVTCYDLSAR